jgi:probable phosphoglycerate mutase
LDADLQEWDYGDCTGYTLEQLQSRYPGWTVWTGPLPNGESLADIAARATRAAERIRTLDGSVAIFAHGHFLRVFATQWLGLPAVSARHLALETSAICVLGEDAGFPAIRAWNLRNGI